MGNTEIKLAKELQEEFVSLTEFEALNIACRIRNNNILVSAFNVNEFSVEGSPSNLEAIGMALGYAQGSGSSLKTGLEYVASSLDEIANALKEKNS